MRNRTANIQCFYFVPKCHQVLYPLFGTFVPLKKDSPLDKRT